MGRKTMLGLALVELSDKVNRSGYGSWAGDELLIGKKGSGDIWREFDFRLMRLLSLTNDVEKVCLEKDLLCRITWSYWFEEIIGNRELVAKYGLVLPDGDSKWLVPVVEVRILLEGTVFVIKVFPGASDTKVIYSWGGSRDWEMNLAEVEKKLEEQIKNVRPLE